MNKGYMLYIQSCATFFRQNDAETLKIKQALTTLLPKYSFLGMCGVMWGFASQTKRSWWLLEASKRVQVPRSEWISSVKALALLTVKKIAS